MSNEADKKRAVEDRKQPSNLPLRIVGGLLVVAALFLYAHDLSAGKRRISGAVVIRNVASESVLNMGLRAAPDDSSALRPIYEPCSQEIASNILARLSLAEPVKFPEAEADKYKAYDLFLFLTNRARVFMRARREPGSDEAFVSLREPRRTSGFGAKEESFSYVEFPPALVTGLGGVFDEIDSGALASLRNARVMPSTGMKAYTNLVRHAGVAGLTEESLSSPGASLRAIASGAEVAGIGIVVGGHTSGNGFVTLERDEVEATVAAIKLAEDAQALPEVFEGDEYALVLLLADGYAVNLRTVIREDDPENALVGFFDILRPEQEGGSPRLVVSSPVLVPGIGKLIASKKGVKSSTSAAMLVAPEPAVPDANSASAPAVEN